MVARVHVDNQGRVGGPVRTARRDPDVNRTVIVACKLPNGIILQNFDWIEERQPVPGGFQMVKVCRRLPLTYTVRGNRLPFGQLPDFPIEHGYAFTPGIPKAFWDIWVEQNEDADIVKNRIVFAFESINDVRDEVANCKGITTGLEPLDPEKSPVAKVTKKKDD